MSCNIASCENEIYVIPEFCYLKTYRLKNNQSRTFWKKIAFCYDHFLHLLKEKRFAFNFDYKNDTEIVSFIGFRLPLLVYDEHNLKDMELF